MHSDSPPTPLLAHCPGRCDSLSCRDRRRLASRTSLRRCGPIHGTPFNGQSGERSRYERVNLARRQVSGFRGSHRILSPRRGHGGNPSGPNPWSDEDISRGERSRYLCRQLVSRRQSCPGNARGITWGETQPVERLDRKSTRLNSSHLVISYAVFCLKKKKNTNLQTNSQQTRIHT